MAHFNNPSSIAPHRLEEPSPEPPPHPDPDALVQFERPSSCSPHRFNEPSPAVRTASPDAAPPATPVSPTPRSEPPPSIPPEEVFGTPQYVTPYGQPENRLTTNMPDTEAVSDGSQSPVDAPSPESPLYVPAVAPAMRTPGTQAPRSTPRRVRFSRPSPDTDAVESRESAKQTSRAATGRSPLMPAIREPAQVPPAQPAAASLARTFSGARMHAATTVSNEAKKPRRRVRKQTGGKSASKAAPAGAAWLPPGGTSMPKKAAALPSAPRRRVFRVTSRKKTAVKESASRGPVLPPLKPLPWSAGALALGATVVELTSANTLFLQCAQLLHEQVLLQGPKVGGVALSVLRVMQCRSHLTEGSVAVLDRASAVARKGGSAGAASPSAPWLAFVHGNSLDAIAQFVRSGLRLLHSHDGTLAPVDGGLVVSKCLTAADCWGGESRDPKTASAVEAPLVIPSLSVWRVVLAMCWPEDGKTSTTTAYPAYIIDYAVELKSLQLGL